MQSGSKGSRRARTTIPDNGSGNPAHTFDAVVIGAGHNGLVCAGYLARAGLSVAVVEQKKVVGGCVLTEEVGPGWRINKYGMEHYVIQNTPIISDLSLERYGLTYRSLEPTVFSPFPDGRCMVFHRTLEKTVSHISGLSKRDARAYEKFHARWSRVQRAIGRSAVAGRPVSLEEALRSSVEISPGDAEIVLAESTLPAGTILKETFETEYVSSPIAFLGPAALGQSPAAAHTGWLVGWHIGAERVARPVGGSGMLTLALARMVEASGGVILTGERVTGIILERGRAAGVVTARGKRVRSKVVASNADPKQTLLDLLDGGAPLGRAEARAVRRIKVTPGFTFKADYLLRGAPRYAATRSTRTAAAATFVAPSVEALTRAHEEFSRGNNPKEPGLMVALHSMRDHSLAPPGKQGLMLETRYTPYAPADGPWTKERSSQEATRLLEMFEAYAPGVSKMVESVLPLSPLDMERDVLVPNGNFLHADMDFDQMFDSRPAEGLVDGYRVRSVEGVYLCGAGAFPGGAISGIPGRNAALQIISEFSSRRVL